jgi:hypothetical protein
VYVAKDILVDVVHEQIQENTKLVLVQVMRVSCPDVLVSCIFSSRNSVTVVWYPLTDAILTFDQVLIYGLNSRVVVVAQNICAARKHQVSVDVFWMAVKPYY